MSYTCPNVLHYLSLVAPVIPFPIYWTSVEARVLGANQACLDAMGAAHPNDVIGQTPYDYYPTDVAKRIVDHIHLVIKERKTLTQEDVIQDISTGKIRYYTAIRSPLIGENGEIMGVIGTSIEITAEKEAERLQVENELQRVALQEKEKFAQLARKVAHDIASPLASLKMLIPLCAELPENKRTFLNKAAEGILDIANNLLSNYHKQNPDTSEVELRQHLLVSDLLIQLLSEKKMQYRNRPVTIETVIAEDAHFAFIRMQPTEFRRTMSNLINNAVDALEGSGKVTIQLLIDAEAVVVKVQDNGKGMTAAMIEKMKNRQGFTEGKENGHGLGLQQVWDTLGCNQGIMEVQSILGVGTCIQLIFPRIKASNWIAQDIYLIPNNIIVILDDDESIHTAWGVRFDSLLTSYPSLEIHHFRQGQEALDFLAGLNQEQKDLVVFLSDYELLQQGKNGLDVIKESGTKRAILVTSYYSNSKIREKVEQLGIKILPKQMAPIIPILFANSDDGQANASSITTSSAPLAHDEAIHIPRPLLDEKPKTQKTPLVLLDDDKLFADTVGFQLASHNKQVTYYPDPTVFLNECERYAKDTPICIDNNFGVGIDIKGTQVAERLHALEFTRLFLLSGDDFPPGTLPQYLTFIQKPEFNALDII